MSIESFPKSKKTPEQIPSEGSPGEPKPPAAEYPNIDDVVRDSKENGEGGGSPTSGSTVNPRIRETDNPGDFTPELNDPYAAVGDEYGSDSNQSETSPSTEMTSASDTQRPSLGPASGDDPFANLHASRSSEDSSDVSDSKSDPYAAIGTEYDSNPTPSETSGSFETGDTGGGGDGGGDGGGGGD